MKLYELTYLVSTELKNEEVEKTASEIDTFLQQEGAIIMKSGVAMPKTLGYQIKRQGSAFILSLDFNSEPETAKKLEETMRKNPRVIRFLVIAKRPARVKKIREREEKKVMKEVEIPVGEKFKKSEKKVELKDIEEKLEEILSE
ncbi:MAG: 30S ribosomal protein S6 [Candidatus Staskawiczbacteria bacterium]|jgi:ribosomal protein S6